MKDFGKYDTHARLVERMTETLGVDVQEQELRGQGPSDAETRDRVYRCISCTEPEMCVKFLDAHLETQTKAPAAPPYCRNKKVLEELAKR